MNAVVQRVIEGEVTVNQRSVGRIDRGIVALVAVQKDDTIDDVNWMAGKLATLRIFRNGDKHFDLDVKQIGGQILLISNFTVAAETRKGRRPSLDGAASPADGRRWFDQLVEAVKAQGVPVATGEFAADMRVTLTNEGPATFIVSSRQEVASC